MKFQFIGLHVSTYFERYARLGNDDLHVEYVSSLSNADEDCLTVDLMQRCYQILPVS